MHFIYFWFNLFSEARAEILKKIVGFVGDLKTSKGHFEINWPFKRQTLLKYGFCKKLLLSECNSAHSDLKCPITFGNAKMAKMHIFEKFQL
jgi:hypothetical protein